HFSLLFVQIQIPLFFCALSNTSNTHTVSQAERHTQTQTLTHTHTSQQCSGCNNTLALRPVWDVSCYKHVLKTGKCNKGIIPPSQNTTEETLIALCYFTQ